MVTSFLSVIYLFAVSGLSCSSWNPSLQLALWHCGTCAQRLAARAWMLHGMRDLSSLTKALNLWPPHCVLDSQPGPPKVPSGHYFLHSWNI